MAKKENNFHKKLLSTFKVEAKEHINAIYSGLIKLEREVDSETQISIIETIFREVHSMKGASRAVNLTDIESVCQSFESVLSSLKGKEIALSKGILDLLHEVVDTIGKLLSLTEAERTASDTLITDIIQRLKDISKTVPPSQKQTPSITGVDVLRQAPAVEKSPTLAPETIRISTAKLDSVLLQVEELLSSKLTAGQRAIDLQKTNAEIATWKRMWGTVYPDLRKVRRYFERNKRHNGNGQINPQLRRILEFLEWDNSFVKSLEYRLSLLTRLAEQDTQTLSRMIDGLLSDMKEVLMFPFSSLLEIFPKLVRDLSRDKGKDVELVIHGADIEIDRRILEEIKDPFIHLVRNCIDHGIEKPEERIRKNKNPRGIISISISQKDSSNIEVLISDDGAGIDISKVKSSATGLSIISQEDTKKLSEKEALSLIFLSGVSTSPFLTDISGRGLGLAIVQEKIEKLGGSVSVESYPDSGTSFRIILPITFATFRGITVGVDEHLFVIPVNNMERVIRVKKEDIKTVENRETILFDGEVVPIVYLGDVLELPKKAQKIEDSGFINACVLGTPGKSIAFSVDEILYKQDVLIKNLPRHLSRIRNIGGVTVLGTGKVVPVLNVQDLMKSAVKISSAVIGKFALQAEGISKKPNSILVVEDSITSRTLLRNILESGGYNVKTAVDGIEAFTMLETEEFDMVVSDVDMPRLNGFGLTEKIRSDKKLSNLPVVLITTLESREDRERGMNVGANAYIVKSSFDQSNLLEVIRRLI